MFKRTHSNRDVRMHFFENPLLVERLETENV
jgi:hypothetical protein